MSAATEAWLARLDPGVLRHLAAAAEGSAHRRRWAAVIDPERTAAELAEILAAGDQPSLGWWRRRVARLTPGPDPVPTPESVAIVASEMLEETGMTDTAVIDAMVTVATSMGLDNFTAVRAARAGVSAARSAVDLEEAA